MDYLDEIRLERLWAKYVRTKGYPPPIQAMDIKAAISFLQDELSTAQTRNGYSASHISVLPETALASGAESYPG